MHDPLTTLTGHTLPDFATANKEDQAMQCETDLVQTDAIIDPTPENLDRLIAAGTKQIAALKQLVLVATAMRRVVR